MSKIIILNNKKCQIISPDIDILKKLHNFLSYKVPGAEYTPAYQNGWSGINYLLSKNGKFNYGLLGKVTSFLKENDVDFVLQDQRIPKTKNQEIDISDKLKSLNLIPRDHQIKIVNAALSTDRGIIRAATGSGKTLATALITAKINKPTIIYVIGLDLLDQFHKLYSNIFDEKIGYIGDGICDIQRINVASIWTIGRALKLDKDIIEEDDLEEKDITETNKTKVIELLQKTKVHILDECHVAQTATLDTIYKNIDPEYLYGFSGTPYKEDGTDLATNNILGEQIINVSASELIKLGILAQPLIKFFTMPKLNAGNNYQTVYKNYIVENDYRNNFIVKTAKDLILKKYTPLILFKQIKHGEIILEKLQENNVKCAMLYGNDTLIRRNEVKEQLIKKEIDLILASTVYDLGVDVPQLNALILAGGGKSSVRALQRIGRVIRAFPGKTMAAVVDFYDQARFLKNHSIIRYTIYSSEDGFKVIKSKEMK